MMNQIRRSLLSVRPMKACGLDRCDDSPGSLVEPVLGRPVRSTARHDQLRIERQPPVTPLARATGVPPTADVIHPRQQDPRPALRPDRSTPSDHRALLTRVARLAVYKDVGCRDDTTSVPGRSHADLYIGGVGVDGDRRHLRRM